MNRFIKENKQISLFITAGFPTLESTGEQILSLQNRGVDFIEVGIPFSDPMADGPVIQQSSAIALENGMNMGCLFQQLSAIQGEVKIPLVLMGYLNPVLQYGMERFLAKCKTLNIASVILPDLSFEIYQRFYQHLFEQYEVPITFLVTPQTNDERVIQIANCCKDSFVYLVSSVQITGELQQQKMTDEQGYERIKKLVGETPLMMGFGISTKQDVERAQQFTDGAIIGSAYIQSIMKQIDFEVI